LSRRKLLERAGRKNKRQDLIKDGGRVLGSIASHFTGDTPAYIPRTRGQAASTAKQSSDDEAVYLVQGCEMAVHGEHGHDGENDMSSSRVTAE
jgi:hypothetical protein